MSSLVYPANLPGLTLDVVRTPNFNTGVQAALSTKESRIAYQQYLQMTWELQYELLRDYTTPSDLKALVGLFTAVGGKYDTFLYSDPAFNSVVSMPFASPDGITTSFQTTAMFANAAGPGGAEIIQNFNGTPAYYLNRYGTLDELLSPVARANYQLQSQTFDTLWSQISTTVTPNTTVAPDGTTTGDSMLETTANAQHYLAHVSNALPGAVQPITFSVFINPSLTRQWALVQLQEMAGLSAISAYVNLTGAGSIGTIFTGANWSGASATITACNNGWYRCTITATNTSSSTTFTPYIISATANGTSVYTGVVTDGLAVWGAQTEIGPAATMYLPTVAATVTQDDYSLGPTGIINTSPVVFPAVGQFQWTGSFFYRCRFDDDAMSVTQFMKNFWENKKVLLKQIKL